MKKKILSLLLVFVMLTSMLPMNVFAADSDCYYFQWYGKHNVWSWSEGDGTHSGTCSVCGQTVSENHTYGSWSYDSMNNNHYRTCSKCNAKETGTCDTNGYTSDYSGHYQACSVCGRKASTTATAHSWAYEVGSNGAGYHKQYCSVCKYTYSDNSSCSYSGQPYVTENGQHWQVCSVCKLAGKKTDCSSWSGAQSNGNGTHSFTCYTCNKSVSVGCEYDDDYGYNDTAHYGICICGNKGTETPHDPSYMYYGESYSYSEGKYVHMHTASCECGYSATEKCTFGKPVNNGSDHSSTCSLCKEVVTEAHTYNNGVCACGAEKHDHVWSLTASGNTIKLNCSGAGTCDVTDKGSVTITAEGGTYDGKEKAAKVSGTGYMANKGSVSSVEYYKNGRYFGKTAPTNVGTYTAKVTYTFNGKSATAEVPFAINKAVVNVTAEGKTVSYDGEYHGITVNAPAGMTVYYGTSASNCNDYTSPTYKNAGTYTVYYRVADNSNYEITGQTGSATVIINPIEVTVSASAYDGPYDGKAHGVTVSGLEGTGLKPQYKGENMYMYSDTAPTYTDAGSYDVAYKVEDSTGNYKINNGEGTVTVNIDHVSLDAAVTASPYNHVYDGKAHGITVNHPDDATIYYSTDGQNWSAWNKEFEDVGTYTVYYKAITNSDNYTTKETTVKSETVTITPLDLATVLNVNAKDDTFTFNRNEWSTVDGYTKYHSIKLDVDKTQVPGTYDHITVEYSKDGGATWSTTNPRFRDAGTYPVKYRIYVKGDYPDYGMSSNYIGIEGEQTVTIKKADLPITGLVGYHGPYDGSTHYGFGYKYTTSYGDYFTLYWYNYLHDELNYSFSWKDETGADRTLTVKAGEEPKLTDFPGFTKQNVETVDSAKDTTDSRVHKVNVTIGSNNYNEKLFTYYVQIGPGGADASNTEYPYDGNEHYIANYIAGQWYYGYGEVYNYGSIKIEYREKGSDKWLPASQEPGQTEVGTKEVEWRVTMDSDQNRKFGEESNSFGSPEVFIGCNTVTVTAVPLTVTANDKTITYGDDAANDGIKIEGKFVSPDTEAVVDKSGLTYTYSYDKTDSTKNGVGTYTITPAGLTAKNYSFTYKDGTLTVEPKEIGIDWSELEFAYDGSAHKPYATATGLIGDDTCDLTVKYFDEDGNEVPEPTEVGTYTVKIVDQSNKNYEPSEKEKPFIIKVGTQEAPVVGKSDETVAGKSDGKITNVDDTMEYSTDGGDTYIPVPDGATEITDLPAGDYLVRYEEKSNFEASEPTEVTVNSGKQLTVTLPSEQVGYELTANKDKLNWHEDLVLDFELKDGYAKGEDFAIKVNGNVVDSATDIYTYMDAETDLVVTVEGVYDVGHPTGLITIKENSWDKFWNNLTFGLLFKETTTVTITAEDKESGVDTIEYYLSDKEMSVAEVEALADSAWTEYTGAFQIDAEKTYVVYAKITDKAGNVSYLNSDGMELDKTAPEIGKVENGKDYYGDTGFTATDDNLDKVTVDGKEIQPDANGNYTIPADNKEHTVVATDKAGNSTTVKVTVYKTYTVKYVANGKVVSEQTIGHGKDAVAPKVPEVEGYYGKWNNDGKKITANTTITAVYYDNNGVVRTGDDNNPLLWAGMLLTATAGMVGIAMYLKKKKDEE